VGTTQVLGQGPQDEAGVNASHYQDHVADDGFQAPRLMNQHQANEKKQNSG